MTFLTPDRLLILALAVTVLAADGIRRMRRQRKEGELEPRVFQVFVAVLIAGSALAWSGFVIVWLRS